jgi:hypothetical protein
MPSGQPNRLLARALYSSDSFHRNGDASSYDATFARRVRRLFRRGIRYVFLALWIFREFLRTILCWRYCRRYVLSISAPGAYFHIGFHVRNGDTIWCARLRVVSILVQLIRAQVNCYGPELLFLSCFVDIRTGRIFSYRFSRAQRRHDLVCTPPRRFHFRSANSHPSQLLRANVALH